MSNDKGLIIVLSGFSGAGKGTIMNHLLAKYPGQYNLSISATTRGKRDYEQDGREYFFKTREEFEEMIKNERVLEYNVYNGNYYGTPRDYVEELINSGKDVLLEIEVHGALQVKKLYPDSLLLFTTPPSAQELKERLVGRGTETAEEVANRMAISVKESSDMEYYDYLIINDVLEDAVDSVHNIIKSEHLSIKRNNTRVNQIKEDLKGFERR